MGCGKSDGDFITFGVNEHKDLQYVIDYLKGTGSVTKIILYGRSMGAGTALLYINDKPDPIVSAVIADSGFADFKTNMKHIETLYDIDKKDIDGVYEIIRDTIKSKHNIDIDTINPIEGLEKTQIPVLFIHGAIDDLILMENSERMHKVYKGKNELIVFEGGHNDPRTRQVFRGIKKFLAMLF